MHSLVEFIQSGFFISHLFLPSWGASIIATTLAIRVLLFPLQFLTTRQQLKLQALKPELDALQLHFKNDAPQLAIERGALMKSAKVNPLWTLVLTAIQMPVLIGMYRAVVDGNYFTLATFFWLKNLAAPDPILILPLLASLVVWMQMIGARQESPKLMKFLIPSFSFLFMFYLPAAVALYSVTNGVLQLAGQKLIEKFI